MGFLETPTARRGLPTLKLQNPAEPQAEISAWLDCAARRPATRAARDAYARLKNARRYKKYTAQLFRHHTDNTCADPGIS
jgi:hypothetical protein